MDFVVFVALMVIFLVVVSFVQSAAKKKRQAAWQLAANTLGMNYDGEKITGTVGGVDLRVQIEVRGTGKSRTEYTVVVLRLAGDLPAGLWIAAEGFMSKVTKYLGSQDVQLGLPEIDPKLMVKGKDENEVRQWAQQAQIARSLSELVLVNGTYYIAAGELRYEYGTAIPDAGVLEGRIRSLVAIAAGLSTAAKSSAAPLTGTSNDDVADFEENPW